MVLGAIKRTGMATCIAGMHRSGTSMVAKLLHDCGLHLGPEEELGFDASNGEPHYENVRFVALNEKVLNRLGGSWDNPPNFPAGWECKPEIQSLILPARKLIAMLQQDHQFWGWKDPRNSLTLAFWRRLIPELTVVICVRNPVEISRSLQARGDLIAIGSAQLWLTYYRKLLAAMPREKRVVTHYECYFKDPAAELQRITNAINLEVSEDTIDESCASVADNLRHHRAETGGLGATTVPAEVRELYYNLCGEAGLVYPRKKDFQKE